MKQDAATLSDNWVDTFYSDFLLEVNSLEEEETESDVINTSAVDTPLDSQTLMYKKVMKYLVYTARTKRFKEAEKARSMLYKINPNATKDIYKAGRFIENEKRKYLAQKKRA